MIQKKRKKIIKAVITILETEMKSTRIYEKFAVYVFVCVRVCARACINASLWVCLTCLCLCVKQNHLKGNSNLFTIKVAIINCTRDWILMSVPAWIMDLLWFLLSTATWFCQCCNLVVLRNEKWHSITFSLTESTRLLLKGSSFLTSLTVSSWHWTQILSRCSPWIGLQQSAFLNVPDLATM